MFLMNLSSFNISKVIYEPEKIVYNPLLFGFVGIFGHYIFTHIVLLPSINLVIVPAPKIITHPTIKSNNISARYIDHVN